MVAITKYHRIEIPLPPFLEIEMVVLWILFVLPAIESFVEHHHAKAVARVEKRGRRWIVAGANCIESICLHQLNPAFLGAVDCRRSQHAIVMVQAAAFQLENLTVNAKAMSKHRLRSCGCQNWSIPGRQEIVDKDLDLSSVEVG